ncbi:MAG: alkaline shock response membrane anchor protein AmaP [Caldilineales bacterium]|nr:alkaline shock response membrane anchor protein AmaP [Caldilineales bacterium]MDW8317258.1 hypothetical protein [Anaerolineae bacterium]
MNVFNRIVTTLLIVAVGIAVIALAVAPDQALATARLGLERLAAVLEALAALQPAWLFPLMRGLVAALATVALVVLLWLELRRPRTPAARVRLSSGGQATVTADSIGRRVAWHVDQLADVVSVEPEVRPHGNSVDVRLRLETAPDTDVPMKTEEVMALTREVVERQLGLQLRKLQVEIHHADFPEAPPGSGQRGL